MEIASLVAVVVVAVLLVAAGTYNGLKSLRTEVRQAWGDMDAALRLRYDLLPALVAVARGTTPPPALAAAMAARNRAAVAFNPQQLGVAESALTAALSELFAAPPQAMVDHPAYARARSDLQASTEAIARASQQYNDRVAAYNTVLRSFPHDWAATAFGFRAQPTFEMGPTTPASEGTPEDPGRRAYPQTPA